ncbi:hypothetical protein GCM10027051_20330 [Niabella terrae]
MVSLSIDECITQISQGAIVLDLRTGEQQREGFIKGSLLVAPARLADYLNILSTYIKLSAPVLLITGKTPAESSALLDPFRNSGIRLLGDLDGGFAAWKAAGRETDLLIEVLPDELMMDIPFDENLVLLDLRPAVAFAESHLRDAVNIPLSQIADPLRMAAIEDKDNLYLIGSGEADAYFAASVLKRNDIHNLRVVTGSWEAVRQEEKADLVKDPELLN